MPEKKINGIPVNNGNGLMDTDGFIDSMVLECNDAVKSLVGGQYLAFCSDMHDLAKRLVTLKDGVKKELDAMRQQLEETKKVADDLFRQLSEMEAK